MQRKLAITAIVFFILEGCTQAKECNITVAGQNFNVPSINLAEQCVSWFPCDNDGTEVVVLLNGEIEDKPDMVAILAHHYLPEFSSKQQKARFYDDSNNMKGRYIDHKKGVFKELGYSYIYHPLSPFMFKIFATKNSKLSYVASCIKDQNTCNYVTEFDLAEFDGMRVTFSYKLVSYNEYLVLSERVKNQIRSWKC